MTDKQSNYKKINGNGNGRKTYGLEGLHLEGGLGDKTDSGMRITEIQDLQLQIIALTSHNNLKVGR